MAHLHALPIGHEFEGYRVERVLGSGGFGITYLAREPMIGRAVAIKEYLPSTVAARAVDSLTVHPLVEADAEVFRWGLKRFRNEARTLVSFHHPNIVQVYRYFEANGTAYLVMAYEEGASLAEILKTARTLPEEEIREFLDPLLSGVAEVHKAGFLHRDIKPANVVIRSSGQPALIDFGAARQALGAKSQSLHAIVSPGYAPFEQYSSTANHGPYTDIYALGAMLYCCVTGTRPVEATDRIAGAQMRPAAELGAGRYSDALLAAIDHALGLMPEDRPQTIAEWRAELGGAPEVEPLKEPIRGSRSSESTALPPVIASAEPTDPPRAVPRRSSRRALVIGLIAGAGVLTAGGGYALVSKMVDDQREREAEEARKAEEEKKRLDEAKKKAEEAARIERERKLAAARQPAEAAASKAREAQIRAQAAYRGALNARQQALNAADCARKAAARARSGDKEHYAGLLTNGGRYEGELNSRTKFPEGCGINIRTDGARYEGQWANNWHGYGVSVSTSGISYEGSYKNGTPDGPGVLRLKNGAEVWMTLVNNVLTGPGVWIDTTGTRYEGDVLRGRWHGYAVLRTADGVVHEGEFADGKLHGLGVQTDARGQKLHGRWDNGQFKGLDP